ncbi:MAG TPA: hypothetical protein VHT28_02330 [Silvibacterium sp.]|nr:hypothetical protein [Silvibacterium sp.]
MPTFEIRAWARLVTSLSVVDQLTRVLVQEIVPRPFFFAEYSFSF